jgi:hypothetical protein
MTDINMAMDIINASSGEYDIYKLRFYLNGTINGLSNLKVGSKIEINQFVYENLQGYINALEFLYSYLEIKDDYNEDWEDWEE